MASQSLESILVGAKTAQPRQGQEPRKPRLQPEQSLKCPRCDSINTKFCYYNNYSLSQPRYFCKSCRRYWTKGGTLRNVPVGGGCRKNKRASSSRWNPESQLVSQVADGTLGGLVNAFDSSDLALAFARLQKQGAVSATTTDNNNNNNNGLQQFGLEDQGLDQGNYNVGVPRPGLLDSIGSGIFETDSMNPSPNFYFGLGNTNSGGEVEYDHVLSMQQELSSGENMMLFGFPWPINGNGNCMNEGITNIRGEVVDSGRSSVSWNSGLNSPWHHGLLNTSPLM
ncbi:hypothetical protein MLD38_004007 [Melastoma candidum]|uniref:Uncharacterized protein n=1 Tax=Melastoma candidum TaxID=119954 RepID=A0ACB9S4D8_9MYRT|nr:hypothetical protein MLD38_004007 [Melastoma candidum]